MVKRRLVFAMAFSVAGNAWAWSSENPKPTGCSWSNTWSEITAAFPPAPKEAKLTNPKRKKGSLERPRPRGVKYLIHGVWTVELVVDEKGDVRDARIVDAPRIDPPWPEYEEAVLKSVRTWKYSPLRVDGRPWPNCMTVTLQDR